MVKIIVIACLVFQSVGNNQYNLARESKEVQVVQTLEETLENIEEIIASTSQITLLDLQYTEGYLVMDLSHQLISYGGGNAVEYQVIKALLDWGFQYEDVDYITLKIEGSTHHFPEGNEVIAYDRDRYNTYYK